jgi:hypothetical protein
MISMRVNIGFERLGGSLAIEVTDVKLLAGTSSILLCVVSCSGEVEVDVIDRMNTGVSDKVTHRIGDVYRCE